MSGTQHEAIVLESRLADLRHQFEDAAAPIVSRLRELSVEPLSTDKILLIPRQVRARSPGTRLPRHF